MRVLVLLCCAVLLAACQPFGGPGPGAAPTAGGSDDARPLGAPDDGLPAALGDLTSRGAELAREWQDEPVLVEVEVDLDESLAWTAARLTYVTAEADNFLTLVAAGTGFTQQRPTLSTVQAQPLPIEAVAQIEEFPAEAVEPAQLVTSAAAGACDIAAPATVLYITGAPVAWDGTAWSSPPAWRATVITPDGSGAALDAVSAEGDCLEE